MTRILKYFAVAVAVLTVAGCKLAVLVSSGGDVQSGSGALDCAGPNFCEFQITDPNFSETFTASARPGFEFQKWQGGPGFYCGDLTSPVCTITVPGGDLGNAVVAQYSTGRIMPLFKDVGIDTDGDGLRNELDEDDDNDGVFDIDDPCPLNPNLECGINDVGGIISEDTVWTGLDGPVRLTQDVQVDAGVTLTIAAGVEVLGQGYEIEMFGGMLVLESAPNNKIVLRDLTISGETTTGIVDLVLEGTTITGTVNEENLNNIDMTNSTLRANANNATQLSVVNSSVTINANTTTELNVTNSTLTINGSTLIEEIDAQDASLSFTGNQPTDIRDIQMSGGTLNSSGCYTLNQSVFDNQAIVRVSASAECDSNVEYNLFRNSSIYATNTSWFGQPQYLNIRHNTFVDYTTEIIEAGSYFAGLIQVRFNNFLSAGTPTLKTHSNYSYVAKQNYWGTQNISVIESMIYDRSDDLNIQEFIAYQPILLSADLDAPAP